MTKPTIKQAREICDSVRARGVIVLAFAEDTVYGASYADTKVECKQLGHTLDQIVEAIENCEIRVWEIGQPPDDTMTVDQYDEGSDDWP
jgi:hypothetical protein